MRSSGRLKQQLGFPECHIRTFCRVKANRRLGLPRGGPVSRTRPEGRGIYIGQLSGSETKLLVDAEVAVCVAAGQLLFGRTGTGCIQPVHF